MTMALTRIKPLTTDQFQSLAQVAPQQPIFDSLAITRIEVANEAANDPVAGPHEYDDTRPGGSMSQWLWFSGLYVVSLSAIGCLVGSVRLLLSLT